VHSEQCIPDGNAEIVHRNTNDAHCSEADAHCSEEDAHGSQDDDHYSENNVFEDVNSVQESVDCHSGGEDNATLAPEGPHFPDDIDSVKCPPTEEHLRLDVCYAIMAEYTAGLKRRNEGKDSVDMRSFMNATEKMNRAIRAATALQRLLESGRGRQDTATEETLCSHKKVEH
jgi:hypothetical protein